MGSQGYFHPVPITEDETRQGPGVERDHDAFTDAVGLPKIQLRTVDTVSSKVAETVYGTCSINKGCSYRLTDGTDVIASTGHIKASIRYHVLRGR